MEEETALGWEERGLTTDGYKISLRDDESVPKLDYGDSCTSLLNILKTLKCTH